MLPVVHMQRYYQERAYYKVISSEFMTLCFPVWCLDGSGWIREHNRPSKLWFENNFDKGVVKIVTNLFQREFQKCDFIDAIT